MDVPTDNLAEFCQLIDDRRLCEAFVAFLAKVEGKSWSDLSGARADLAMLDRVCRHVLPELLEDYTLWLVNHPGRIRKMLELLAEALRVEYRPAATVDQIAWLRCLLAISEAMAGRPERVHEELCLVETQSGTDSVPSPNGTFSQQIQGLQLGERSAGPYLDGVFVAYMEFLRRAGRHESANHLEARIGKLLGLIARDEKRPGVVQALLYNRGQGYSRFVHVSLERLQPGDGDSPAQEGIVYAGRSQDTIDPAMQDGAACARLAADAYLRRSGYPDGLAERLARWELAALDGDATGPSQSYVGGSVALPLAVAIVSQYLARAVPNDVALTGSFAAANVAAGQVLPVDGIGEKLEHAVVSGNHVVYFPAGNAPDLDGRPALGNLAAEHNVRLAQEQQLDGVCDELFCPEGSGRLKDLLGDTLGNLRDMLRPDGAKSALPSARPVHHRHRLQVYVCVFLISLMVLLEGWMVYKAFAPDYSPVGAWGRIIAATALVFAGTCITFALPGACLRHRKSWSWLAGIVVLVVCFAAGVMLIGPMLPHTTWISFVYNAPPAAGVMKDMFFMWLFAWAVAANIFNVIAALEHLVANRQFVTARSCLGWNSPLEARVPIRCLGFPWQMGLVAITAAAAFVMVFELNYYASLRPGTSATYWQTFLGLGRDLLILAALAEVMLFYKLATTNVRQALA